jgi:hypothetical protein
VVTFPLFDYHSRTRPGHHLCLPLEGRHNAKSSLVVNIFFSSTAPLLAESRAPGPMFSIRPSFPWKLVSASNYGGYSAFRLRTLPAKSVPLYRQLPFCATSCCWVLTRFQIALVYFGPRVLVVPPRNLTPNTWGLVFLLPSPAWSFLSQTQAVIA